MISFTGPGLQQLVKTVSQQYGRLLTLTAKCARLIIAYCFPHNVLIMSWLRVSVVNSHLFSALLSVHDDD